jgi:hypothetical protein
MSSEITKVTSVSSSVAAQYIQKRLFTTTEFRAASQFNRGIAKNEATNVTGRKATVTAARVFIDEESRLPAVASVLEFFARVMLRFAL